MPEEAKFPESYAPGKGQFTQLAEECLESCPFLTRLLFRCRPVTMPRVQLQYGSLPHVFSMQHATPYQQQ